MKKAVWFTFLAAIAISCLDNPDCFRLDNSNFGMSFRVLGYGNDSDSLDNVVISGAGIATVNKPISAVEFQLPLNAQAQSLSYIFNWTDGHTDTLIVGYTSQIQFVSADCGKRNIFDHLTVTHSTFDSVNLYNAKPTNPTSINILVFRCANPTSFGLSFKRVTDTTSLANNVYVTTDSALAIKSITSRNGEPIILPDDTLQAVYLPLDIRKDTSYYEFDLGDAGKRSFVVTYTRKSKVPLLESCQDTILFTDLNMYSMSFDAVYTKVINKSTADPAILNLEVDLYR